MSKETFYFSHDYNAREDEKIKELVYQNGMLGYGIYWAIVEMLYQNANALRTKYSRIAFDLHQSHDAIVKSVITEFELFKFSEDGEYFYSESIERRLEKRNEKSEKARQSALNRWNKSESNANASKTHSEIDAIKESKVKESKVNILLEKETKDFDFLKSESLDDKISEPEERKKVAPKKEIQLPFSSKEFKAQWDLWKVYKKKRHKFQYFDEQSEEKALTELFNLSKQNETTANLILRQSIDKGWKGLFELKTTQQNGPTNQNGFSNPSSAGNYKIPGKTSARQFLAREYSDQLKRSDQGGNITVDVEVVE